MISNQHKERIEKAIAEATTLRDAAGWNEKKKGKNIVLSTRKATDCEIDIVKIVAEVPQNIEKVVKYYQNDLASQKKGRDMCNNLEIIEKIDDDTSVILYRTKSKLVVDPREIIGVQHVKKVSDTEWILTRANLGEHPNVPLTKDAIRADGKVYTLFFTKLSETSTRLQAIMHMDPKGSIPIMLVNSLTEESISHFESDITIMCA